MKTTHHEFRDTVTSDDGVCVFSVELCAGVWHTFFRCGGGDPHVVPHANRAAGVAYAQARMGCAWCRSETCEGGCQN
jgi:hypothetical protein